MSVLGTMASAITEKPTSLRVFGRAGALILGVASGSIAATSAQSANESKLRASIAEAKSKIAELEAEKAALSEPTGPASTGDPVQDWINTL